jgi:7-cyano-7-deazaguanine synthase
MQAFPSPQNAASSRASSPLSRATVAVLFSGGLDSAILLTHLLAQQQRVQPLFVDSDLFWQPEELRWARRFLQAVDSPSLEPLIVLTMSLADVYGDHWSITGRDVPGADDPDENVYLPGRNPLLMIKAQVWCRLHGVSQLALGALKSNPFADAQDDFFRPFEAAMDRAVSGHVKLVRPLATLDKLQVMHLGRGAPLEWTFSCLAPTAGLHCGKCNKCAERQQAFRQAEMNDPTRYAAAECPIAIY